MDAIRKILAAAAAILFLAGTLSAQESSAGKKNREGQVVDACVALTLGDARTAEKILTELAENPDDDAALYYLGLCEIGRNQFSQAREHLEKAARLDPGNFWYRDALALACSLDGDEEKTVETYEQALKDFPKRNELYFNLVNLYLRLGRNEDALAAMDQIETVFGKSEAVTSTRYDLLMREDKPDEALQVLADYNESFSSPVILSRMGDHLMAQAKDTLAMDCYREAVVQQPDYAPALLGLSEVYRVRRDYPGYFSTLDAFVGNADIEPAIKTQYLGRLLGMAFREESGTFLRTFMPMLDSLMSTVVTLHPTDSAALSTAGAYYNSTGRGEEACQLFLKNKEAHPEKETAHVSFIQALAYNGRWEEAIAACDSAIARFPSALDFYELKNGAYYNTEQYDALIANCHETLRRFPDDKATTVSTLATIGDFLHEQGNDKEAFQYYKKALKADPDYAPALNNYAYYLAMKGKKLEKAYQMSKKTVELEPDNPTYLDTVGWILHLLGRSEEAKAYFKHAMLYGGKDSATCLAHYSIVLKALGEEELSKVYRTQAETRAKEGKE